MNQATKDALALTRKEYVPQTVKLNLTSKHPLAPNVAYELGASCNQDAEGFFHVGNGVTQKDFDSILKSLLAAGARPLNILRQKKYDNVQSEGHGFI